jgi:hypothetical protein
MMSLNVVDEQREVKCGVGDGLDESRIISYYRSLRRGSVLTFFSETKRLTSGGSETTARCFREKVFTCT